MSQTKFQKVMNQQENLSSENKSLKKAKILKLLFFAAIILLIILFVLSDYLENYLREEYLLGLGFSLLAIFLVVQFEISHVLKKGGQAAEKLRSPVSKTWGWGLVINAILGVVEVIIFSFFFYNLYQNLYKFTGVSLNKYFLVVYVIGIAVMAASIFWLGMMIIRKKEYFSPPIGSPERKEMEKKIIKPVLLFILGMVVIVLGLKLVRVFEGKPDKESGEIFNQQPIPRSGKSLIDSKQVTAGWPIYRNGRYGYELRYPHNMKTEKPTADVFIIRTQDREYLQIQYLNTTPPNESNYRPNYANFVGVVNIGGKKAQKYYTNNPKGEGAVENIPYTNYVIVIGDKQWIQIEYYGEKEVAEIFEQILSTFKFLD